VNDIYFGDGNATDDSRTVKLCWAVKREQYTKSIFYVLLLYIRYDRIIQALEQYQLSTVVVRVALELAAR